MSLLADVRHVFRTLRRSPGYFLTATATLAVAIGANSAIFSAVHAVLLRPLPVVAPQDLSVVWQTDEGGQAVVELTYRHLREWTQDRAVFTQAAVMASHTWSAVLEGAGEPARLWYAGVSGSFFETLGVRPAIGRTLAPSDDVPNGPAVAVLNHATWVRRFGSDASIVGRSLVLNGQPVQVVGVMPPDFNLPRGAEYWTPVVPMLATGTPPSTANLDTFGVFYVVGRLRPGLDQRGVATAVDAAEARLDQSHPGRLKWGARAVATPWADYVFGPVRPALWALWSAVGVLLLVACANVSGLLLTRVSARRREQAVRLALGAPRSSIRRLWVAEIAIVAAIGGGCGLIGARWLLRGIVGLAPDDLPRLNDIVISLPVALFTFAVVTAVAIVTGLAPLRETRATQLVDAFAESRATSGRRTQRARSLLLVVQMALAVVLLVGTGLVVRSFLQLRSVDLGFRPDRVLTAVVQARGVGQPPNQWLHQFLQRVRALPGVESAGAVYLRPLMLGPIGQGVRVYLEGQPETRESADANPTLNHQIATPAYFEAMGIAVKRGRAFSDEDTAQAPRVAVVSESTARRLWPGRDPLGQRFSMATFTPGGPPRAPRTVVGVVSDVRYRGLNEVQLDVYDPALQVGRPADNVVIRTAGAPEALAPAIRALVREMSASALVDGVTTMDAVVARARAPWRLTTWLFVGFGAVSMALAALGLFSLVAIDVAQRTREFAIRLALGASRGAIVASVLARAAWQVGVGVCLGLGVAAGLSRSLRSVLFGIAPTDAITYLTVLLVVIVVVCIAAYLPARRAARTHPQALLRQG